ncbi:MAG: ester cyclase [Actinomycetota bacterium]|nr:ester cyclase [Actinomycetota bacterium]
MALETTQRPPGRGFDFVAALSGAPLMVWWGGVAVISGGTMFVLAAFVSFALAVGLISPLSPGYEMFAEEYAAKRMLLMAYELTGPLGSLLVATGMFGVLALSRMRFGKLSGTTKTGVVISLVSGFCAAAIIVYAYLPRYSTPEPIVFYVSHGAYAASFLGWICGVLLVGIPAFRVGSLGRWRFMFAPLALACFPAYQIVFFLIYPMGFSSLMEPGFALAAAIETPRALGGVGWILFGLVLLGAHEKELALKKKENLALVRRFYEEVWNKGAFDLADEILAPGFVNHRHRAEGAENFKHYLAALHATFPDLDLAIQTQTSDGENEVATRCEMRGTDRGGVLYYPPTNKIVAFTGIFTDTVRDGRITAHRGEIDEAALFEQLGHEKPRIANRESRIE